MKQVNARVSLVGCEGFGFHFVDSTVWLKSPGVTVHHFYSYITFFTALVLQSVPDQLATAFCED